MVCFTALAASVSAKASTVYDNSGPDTFAAGGFVINHGQSVEDSFSLNSSATIDAISFGDWLDSGSTLDSVNWEIATAPNGGTIVGSGTATAFSNVYENSLLGYTANDSTFDISSLSLAADTTYYLELSNAETSDGGYTAWDFSNNPNSSGYLNGAGGSTSETFALYGSDIAATPEPSSLLLLGSGLAGLVLAGAMRRRAMVTSQAALGA